MTKYLKTFLFSFLTPGLGYLQNGDKRSFYKTITIFFAVIILGIALRLVINFWSFALIFIALSAIYVFTIINATLKVKATNQKIKNNGLLKTFFTVAFLLITGLSFANRRTVMGFDIMSMNVPVMEPTVLQDDKFLVNTWAYKKVLPKRGDIVVHLFNEQKGLYLNRIVAIGNDKIEIKNGIVFLNEQILNEPYVFSENITKPESKDMKTFVIPNGQYFVMGDNRDDSFGDSRFSGTISINNIVGKVTDLISSQDIARIGKTLK